MACQVLLFIPALPAPSPESIPASLFLWWKLFGCTDCRETVHQSLNPRDFTLEVTHFHPPPHTMVTPLLDNFNSSLTSLPFPLRLLSPLPYSLPHTVCQSEQNLPQEPLGASHCPRNWLPTPYSAFLHLLSGMVIVNLFCGPPWDSTLLHTKIQQFIIQQIFIKHFFCARSCSRCWRYIRESSKQKSLPPGTLGSTWGEGGGETQKTIKIIKINNYVVCEKILSLWVLELIHISEYKNTQAIF